MSLLVDHHGRGGKTRVRRVWIVLGVVAVVIVGLRLALTPLLVRYVNGKLDEIPEYSGRIDDVDLHLIRGAYRIEGIKLEKTGGKVPVPFFKAEAVDLSVEWRALLRGKLVSEIIVWRPELNFVQGPPGAKGNQAAGAQTGIDESWTKKVQDLAPFDINRFRIREGQIHYRDFHRSPKVDIHVDHLEAEARGLTNERTQGDSLPATFNAVYRVMGHADGRIEMRIAPLAPQPTFDLNSELKLLQLARLNDFFKAYAHVDVEGGTFSLFMEAAAAKGRFKGYVKPLIKDMKILEPEKDDGNPLQLAWETLVGAVGEVFENQPKEQTALQIPFSGSFENPKAAIIPTVWSLLRNAFVRALKPNLTKTIDIGDVGGAAEKGADKDEDKQK